MAHHRVWHIPRNGVCMEEMASKMWVPNLAAPGRLLLVDGDWLLSVGNTPGLLYATLLESKPIYMNSFDSLCAELSY